jgi:hypothetical protein
MNGVIHSGSPWVNINVGIISPSGWSPWLTLASYYGWNVGWLAVDKPHTTKSLKGIHKMSLDQVTPSWLRGSVISLLLSDLRLPLLEQKLWTEASPLRAAVGCHPTRRLGKPSKECTSSILPCNHARCGGVSAVLGKLHLVMCTIEGWDTSWSYPRLPRCQLSLILSATIGGRPYTPPHKALCPPGA